MEPSLESRLNEALGYIRNQREQIAKLRSRLDRLENVVMHCLNDEDHLWLFRNREERCDPTVPIFDAERASFHAARYEFASQFVVGKSVVDIACGTGYGSRILCEKGNASHVTGIDISADAVRYATRKHKLPINEFMIGSAEEIPLENETIDVVVSFETIEHVPADTKVIFEFARILRPNGMLIISTPNNWPLEIAPFHTQVYNRNSFTTLLQSRFAVESMFNQNSGSPFPYNHGQNAGIVPTTDANFEVAECFIAICRKK